jgi:hypothetical protein
MLRFVWEKNRHTSHRRYDRTSAWAAGFFEIRSGCAGYAERNVRRGIHSSQIAAHDFEVGPLTPANALPESCTVFVVDHQVNAAALDPFRLKPVQAALDDCSGNAPLSMNVLDGQMVEITPAAIVTGQHRADEDASDLSDAA